MAVDRSAAEQAIVAFLRALGRDPEVDPELQGTPSRVASTYADELCAGYSVDPTSLVRPQVIVGTTALVALRDVAVTTTCPHHLMPASGVGTIAFAPRARLVGLGVMADLLDACARRLTLQEEIGERVVSTLGAELEPRWVACRLVMSHACMTARGERKHGAKAETLAFLGDPADRAEALAVVRGAT